MNYALRTELELLWELKQYCRLSHEAFLSRLDDIAWEYDLEEQEVFNLMLQVDSYKW